MKYGRGRFGKAVIFAVLFATLVFLSASCTSASVNSIQLTTSTADDIHPSWSPDGTKILFSSNRSGNYDIWIMDSDGSNMVQLTSNSSDEKYAVWNHAGNKIAFTRWYPLELWRGGGYAYQLWIMNSDGSNPQKLNVNDTWRLISPTWSPDDTKIAFASYFSGNIYSYDIAAATTTDITPPDERWPNGGISRVSWGPTDRIAYERGPMGIQTIDSSGGDYQVIVPEFEIGHFPVQADWSPNGTRFVFSFDEYPTRNLALAWNIPNSREEVLENTASEDEWPSWNPANESEIVFMSGGDYFFGSHDICVYNPQTAWKKQSVTSGEVIQGVQISDNLAVVYDSDSIWAYNPQLDAWKRQHVGGILCPAPL
jgi:Tol biopolymer transport system component